MGTLQLQRGEGIKTLPIFPNDQHINSGQRSTYTFTQPPFSLEPHRHRQSGPAVAVAVIRPAAAVRLFGPIIGIMHDSYTVTGTEVCQSDNRFQLQQFLCPMGLSCYEYYGCRVKVSQSRQSDNCADPKAVSRSNHRLLYAPARQATGFLSEGRAKSYAVILNALWSKNSKPLEVKGDQEAPS